jgi:hypothetical protein
VAFRAFSIGSSFLLGKWSLTGEVESAKFKKLNERAYYFFLIFDDTLTERVLNDRLRELDKPVLFEIPDVFRRLYVLLGDAKILYLINVHQGIHRIVSCRHHSNDASSQA